MQTKLLRFSYPFLKNILPAGKSRKIERERQRPFSIFITIERSLSSWKLHLACKKRKELFKRILEEEER